MIYKESLPGTYEATYNYPSAIVYNRIWADVVRKKWTSSESDSAHEKLKNAVSTYVVAIRSFMFPMSWQQPELMWVHVARYQ